MPDCLASDHSGTGMDKNVDTGMLRYRTAGGIGLDADAQQCMHCTMRTEREQFLTLGISSKTAAIEVCRHFPVKKNIAI
jgi:hypothetical protein